MLSYGQKRSVYHELEHKQKHTSLAHMRCDIRAAARGARSRCLLAGHLVYPPARHGVAVRRGHDRDAVPLQHLRLGAEVFIPENIRCLRIVSWCCVAAGAICLVSTLFYIPFAAIATAAGFMALIVRIVKNVFEQAIRMKDELDYTI